METKKTIKIIHPLHNYEQPKPEKNSGEKVIESSGFIPPHKKIQMYMDAGRALQTWREETYDFPDGNDSNDDDIMPPKINSLSEMDVIDSARKSAENIKNRLREVPENTSTDTTGASQSTAETSTDKIKPKTEQSNLTE